MFKAYHLKFSTRGPKSEMVKPTPRSDPGKGDPWKFSGTPQKGPQRGPRPPDIAKQVIDWEKLSTSDAEIGYCV